MTANYIKNEAWSIVYENDLLVLTAGADKIFAIDDVDEPTANEVLKVWHAARIDLDSVSSEAMDVFEQLKTAGIIINQIQPKTTYKIALEFVGDIDAKLKGEIEDQLDQAMTIAGAKDQPDLVVIIRTNGTLRDLVAGPYATLKTPHLFIDAALEHSISLGPLVFKGDTACLGCLAGRLTSYWGDATPPRKPAMLQNSALIAGLITMEVLKILTTYNRELVNTTVSYDFESYKVRKDKIYKLPNCPMCSSSTIDIPGAIKLPWIQQSS